MNYVTLCTELDTPQEVLKVLYQKVNNYTDIDTQTDLLVFHIIITVSVSHIRSWMKHAEQEIKKKKLKDEVKGRLFFHHVIKVNFRGHFCLILWLVYLFLIEVGTSMNGSWPHCHMVSDKILYELSIWVPLTPFPFSLLTSFRFLKYKPFLFILFWGFWCLYYVLAYLKPCWVYLYMCSYVLIACAFVLPTELPPLPTK